MPSLISHREAQTSAAADANALMRLQLQQNEARAAAEARASDQALELTKIQLQLQYARQAAATGTAHVAMLHQSLSALRDLGLALTIEQTRKKQMMEQEIIEKCLSAADPPPDPLAAISAHFQLWSPAPSSTVPRPNAAGGAAAARPSAAGGGAAQLHPRFQAALQ